MDHLLSTTMGLLESLSTLYELSDWMEADGMKVTAAEFQVFHKWLIGRLRPHFLGLPFHLDRTRRAEIRRRLQARCHPARTDRRWLPPDHV